MSDLRDSLDRTPGEVLEEALKFVNTDPEPPTKTLVLMLWDDDGDYSTKFHNAGMKCSEVITLCEVIKNRMLNYMNSDSET